MRISDWSSDVCSSDLNRGCCRTSANSSLAASARGARAGWVEWGLQKGAAGLEQAAITPGRIETSIAAGAAASGIDAGRSCRGGLWGTATARSEEHTSELQSLMRISYAVFCLKKKKKRRNRRNNKDTQ